jgi:hypothetical protein
MAGHTAGIFGGLSWALTLADCECHGRRVVHRGRFSLDHRGGWLDVRRGERWLGERRSFSDTIAIASALLSPAFLALFAGSIDLVGMPNLPASCSNLAVCAAITSLGKAGQKPAFTTFEQAPVATGVPTAGTGWLTVQQSVGKLESAHGRYCSRAVRRREGGTSRRHFALMTRSRVERNQATRTSQITCSTSRLPAVADLMWRESQRRDQPIAEWLRWVRENGSVRGRC